MSLGIMCFNYKNEIKLCLNNNKLTFNITRMVCKLEIKLRYIYMLRQMKGAEMELSSK